MLCHPYNIKEVVRGHEEVFGVKLEIGYQWRGLSS